MTAENTIPDNQPPKLTPKEAAFVRFYAQCLNASKAARLAGYAESSARVQGHRLITNDNIKKALAAEFDKQAMTPEEGIRRLTDWGRGSIEPFLTEQGAIDMEGDAARENLHLVKKYEVRERVYGGGREGSEPIVERTFKLELHDAKDAVHQILDLNGRFVQRTDNHHVLTGFDVIRPRRKTDADPDAQESH